MSKERQPEVQSAQAEIKPNDSEKEELQAKEAEINTNEEHIDVEGDTIASQEGQIDTDIGKNPPEGKGLQEEGKQITTDAREVEEEQTNADAREVEGGNFTADTREAKAEGKQTNASAREVEEEQTNVDARKVEGEQTNADASEVEGGQTNADAHKVEGEQTNADDRRIEGEQTNADASEVEGEQTNADVRKVEGEQTNADLSEVEGEQTNADASGVEGEQTNADARKVEGEQTNADSSEVEGEQTNADARRIKEEQSNADAHEVEGEQIAADVREAEEEGKQTIADAHEAEEKQTNVDAQETDGEQLKEEAHEVEGEQIPTDLRYTETPEEIPVRVEGGYTVSGEEGEGEELVRTEKEQIIVEGTQQESKEGEGTRIKVERNEKEAEPESSDREDVQMRMEIQESPGESATPGTGETAAFVARSVSEPEVKVTTVKSLERSASAEKTSDSKTSTISVDPADTKASAESINPEGPMAPRSSHLSYDGHRHPQHREVRAPEITEALDQMMEEEPRDAKVTVEASTGASPATQEETQKAEQTFSYRARVYDEKKTIAAMRKTPARHEFVGYIYSSQSQRPRGLSNYFLPVVPQPLPRKHIQIKGVPVPAGVLHPSAKSSPRGLLPLSTVRISWSLSLKHTLYTLPDLYAYLTRFGAIEAIYQRSPNSVIVVFCDLMSARACVKCPDLGMPWDRLIASWWEPRLHNNGYLVHHIWQEQHENLAAML